MQVRLATLQHILARLPAMSLDERAELSQLLEQVIPAPPYISFKDFIARVDPTYQWSWWNELLVQRLQELADGTGVGPNKLNAIMLIAPPRHGKTYMIDELFTAYYNFRFPLRWVTLAMHTEAIAFEELEKTRAFYLRAEGTLLGERDSETRRKFRTTLEGGMRAVGVLGALTRTAHATPRAVVLRFSGATK